MFAGTRRGEVRVLDWPTRHVITTLKEDSGRGAFSPDGKLLVGINAQGKAHIWRAPSFDEIAAAETRSDTPPTATPVP